MADVTVKPEVKVDPAASTPREMKDIQDYADVPDLEMPLPPEQGGSQAWLVKVPRYLWQQWADIYHNHADEEPIQIGNMHVKTPKDPNHDPLQQKVRISLMERVPQHRGLPLNYDVKLKSTGYDGHVVFSEIEKEDTNKNKKSYSGRPNGIQSKQDRFNRNKKPVAPNTYGSAIMKNTALAPVIHHVADAMPTDDDSFQKFNKKLYDAAIKPKSQTTFSDKIDKTLHPSARGGNLGAFNAFGLSSRPSAKKKAPKEKAVRIPQGELLDALDKCFRRYKYWSLKALRNELKQPEAYIKQTLEQIAVLVRSGDFSMTYMLKPEYTAQNAIKDEDVKQEHVEVGSDLEEGGSATGSAGGSGEESEDDLEGFEDVKMEG